VSSRLEILALALPVAALAGTALRAQNGPPRVVAPPVRVVAPPVPPAAPQLTRVLRCPDLMRFDGAVANAAVEPVPDPVTRFVEVLRHVPIGDAPPRSLGLTIGKSTRGHVLLARGTAEQVATVEAALGALARPDVGRTRLQCTLVTMPVAVATAHRLEPGKTVVGDGVAWGELMRDAVKARGRVDNLPELLADALSPFANEVKPPAAPSTPVERPRQRLRGEVVPLDGGDVAVAVAIERGRAAAADAKLPVLATPVFRLAAGKSAMMMAVDGDTAVVLVVRCLETGVAAAK
jgi:hypothetical protein